MVPHEAAYGMSQTSHSQQAFKNTGDSKNVSIVSDVEKIAGVKEGLDNITGNNISPMTNMYRRTENPSWIW